MAKYIHIKPWGESMGKKIILSFKSNELEKEILEYLEEQSKLVGVSAYLKQLIYEKMLKDKKDRE
jgi:hypothetical protein